MLSPPLDMQPKWFAGHTAYSLAKYGMSLCVLGMAAEFAGKSRSMRCGRAPPSPPPPSGWRRAAMKPPRPAARRKFWPTPPMRFSTSPKASAAHFLIDDNFLAENGVSDFDRYRVDPSQDLIQDFFVPDDMPPPKGVSLKAVR